MKLKRNESIDARQLFELLIEGNQFACMQWLDDYRESEDPSALEICELLTEAMYLVGDAWECDRVAIYREHVVSQTVYEILQMLRLSLPSAPGDAPIAIGCTPSNDPYSLATCMVEIVLKELGWRTVSLGTNLPLEEILPAIDHYRPRLCWISVTATESVQRLRDDLKRVGSAVKELGTQVICGGRATNELKAKGDLPVEILSSLRALEQFCV